MIIGYLTNQYARASDTFIRSEVEQLRRNGHLVHTFSVRRPDDDQLISDSVRRERANTHYILEQGMARLLASVLWAFTTRPGRGLAAAHLAWRTRQHGIARVVRQVAYFVEACHLARCLRATGVQHLHNHFADNSASVAMLTSVISGIPYSSQVHGPQIFYAPVAWALSEKISRSAFTSCISYFCRSQCMAFASSEMWDRLHIVHCGLDASFLDEVLTPIPTAPKLVCVGRLSEEKGQLVLIEAIRQLAAEGSPVEVTLVGDGPMRPAIESFVRHHNLSARIHLRGWCDSDAVRQEIRAARGLVLSSFAEGLPVVIMEAMALGRPVIATAIAGIPELVEPGVSGWLIPAGSIDGLTTAIRELTATPINQLEAMGRAASTKVARHHDIRSEVAWLETLFEASIAGELDRVCPDGARTPIALPKIPA